MATKYNLTDSQIRQLANVFYLEQGNVSGVKACASHACNYYEKWQKSKYSSVYECVIYSGWWGQANSGSNSVMSRMNNNVAPTACIEAVGEVIRDGKRTLPEYVDEYDWLYDITSSTNNGKAINPLDRSAYVKDVTVVKNRFGSTWTFYCFPDGASGYCDPFGYISKPAGASSTSGKASESKPADSPKSTYTTSIKMKQVKNGSKGEFVVILQSILYAMGYCGANGMPLDIDGVAGPNLVFAIKKFQEAVGFTPDGVCGPNTWKKIKEGLKV